MIEERKEEFVSTMDPKRLAKAGIIRLELFVLPEELGEISEKMLIDAANNRVEMCMENQKQ